MRSVEAESSDHGLRPVEVYRVRTEQLVDRDRLVGEETQLARHACDDQGRPCLCRRERLDPFCCHVGSLRSSDALEVPQTIVDLPMKLLPLPNRLTQTIG